MVYWHSDKPSFSISRTRLYYLTYDSQLHYLQPDGSVGVATRIEISLDQAAIFAVSPDDSRIAVTILSYSPRMITYLGMRMYVEDLQGAGNHVELFASTTLAEYPVGWVGGRVLVAVGGFAGPQSRPYPNPYGASVYHVADAANGDRLASLCDNSRGPVGWIEPAGTMCSQPSGGPSFVRWDGTPFPAPAATPNSYQLWQVTMSPDGSHVALAGDQVRILGGADDVLPVSAWNVFGWLDASHIVYQRPAARVISIFDLQGQASADVVRGTTYLGALPVAVT